MSVQGNPTAALGQAQASVGDDAAMAALRGAVARTQPAGVALLSLDDAAVAELAAAGLASGTLGLGPSAAPPPLFRLSAPRTAPPPPAASAAPASPPRAAPSPAPAPAAAEGTFAASLDATAMADTLREAAQTGAAFCEECEREAMA